MTDQQKFPELFLSLPHECSYLPGRQASTLFVDPYAMESMQHYGQLLGQGFRRSGKLVYRPHCGECHACVAVRVPVNQFNARRGQKRILNRNQDIIVTETEPRFSDEHFSLYCAYQNARHPNGGMDHGDPNAYEDFLVNSQTNTRFFEMRQQQASGSGALLAVAVTDIVENGLSAVYTYFDPTEVRRGLGVFAVLWQIQHAARLNLPYVYLGYWIKDCQKMSYKQDFRPLEGFQGGHWGQLHGSSRGRPLPITRVPA